MNGLLMFLLLCGLGALCYWFFFKCVDWFGEMYTILLIISILIFIYLMYVLVRPEKF